MVPFIISHLHVYSAPSVLSSDKMHQRPITVGVAYQFVSFVPSSTTKIHIRLSHRLQFRLVGIWLSAFLGVCGQDV